MYDYSLKTKFVYAILLSNNIVTSWNRLKLQPKYIAKIIKTHVDFYQGAILNNLAFQTELEKLLLENCKKRT